MFFSQYIVVQKGPLSKVWLAAHYQRKLTKNLVVETDIEQSVKTLTDPGTPLALRLSGQLLLGLVRIYSKKARYLQEDCGSAMANIKVVYKTGNVDLPDGAGKASVATITLPEGSSMDFDAVTLEDLEGALDLSLDDNVAHEDEITQRSQRFSMGGERSNEVDSDIELPRQGPSQAGDDFNLDGGDVDLLDFDAVQNASRDPANQSSLVDFDDGGMEDMSSVNMSAAAPPSGQPTPAPARSAARRPRGVRKRQRAADDEATEISSKDIKKQLSDTKAITREHKLLDCVSDPNRARTATARAAAMSDFTIFLGDSLAPELVEGLKKMLKERVRAETKQRREEDAKRDDAKEDAKNDSNDVSFDDGFGMGGDASTYAGGADASFGDFDVQDGVSFDQKDYDAGDDDEAAADAADARALAEDRVVKMYHFLKTKIGRRKEMTLAELLGSASRKAAAGVFHEVLVLKTRHDIIDVEQEEAYGTIRVIKKRRFNEGIAVAAQ